MRIQSAIIGLLLFGQLSCSNDDLDVNSFGDDSSITTLNGTWRVISFEDHSTNTVEYKTEENSWGNDIVVTFDDTSDPNLFSGTVTTNTVQGEFEYVEPRKFKMTKYGSTYVAQPEWADKFNAALLDNNVPFRINNNELRLYYDDSSKSITLIKE